MRVTKTGKNKSPEQKAIDTVVAENGHQELPQNDTKSLKVSKKKVIGPNLSNGMRMRIYEYTNCLTGEKENISDSQLVEKAKEYIAWARKERDDLPLMSTFWRCNGIHETRVFDFCDTNEVFKDLVQAGDEFCGDRRETLLKTDFTHLRNRQSVYVPAYKRHDEHMLELRERIKHLLDKEDEPNRQEWATLFAEVLAPIVGKKKEENGSSKPTDNNPATGNAEQVPTKDKV